MEESIMTINRQIACLRLVSDFDTGILLTQVPPLLMDGEVLGAGGAKRKDIYPIFARMKLKLRGRLVLPEFLKQTLMSYYSFRHRSPLWIPLTRVSNW